MSLDTDIQDWSLEHDRSVRNVIRVSAINYRSFFNKEFPADVMVIGNNWFYIARINYMNGDDEQDGEGNTLASSQAFTINPKHAMGTSEYVPLDAILIRFQQELGNDIALFPVTEERTNEAKELGTQGQIRDDWFEVHYNGKTIKVFLLQPNETAIYFGKTSEGNEIGYTQLNTDSPLQ